MTSLPDRKIAGAGSDQKCITQCSIRQNPLAVGWKITHYILWLSVMHECQHKWSNWDLKGIWALLHALDKLLQLPWRTEAYLMPNSVWKIQIPHKAGMARNRVLLRLWASTGVAVVADHHQNTSILPMTSLYSIPGYIQWGSNEKKGSMNERPL